MKNILTGIDSMTLIVQGPVEEHLFNEINKNLVDVFRNVKITISNNVAMVAVVGRDINTSPSIAFKVLSTLSNRNINVKMIDHGSGKMNIMLAVDSEDYVASVQAIYNEFAKV